MSHARNPIACSLPLDQAASQLMVWRDLHTHALASEQIDHGIAITYPLDVARAVEELVIRESACCGWLQLSMSSGNGVVRLELRSDHPDGAPVIALLAGDG